MNQGARKNGAALIYVIAVLVLIAVLSVAILRMTASSTTGYVVANSINQARYMAEAGLHYAAGQTESELELLRSGGPATFSLGSDGTFTLTVGTKDSMVPDKYPVRSVSVVSPGTAMEARYDLLAQISPIATNSP
jgi:Tfp pilus assembly protein PilX